MRALHAPRFTPAVVVGGSTAGLATARALGSQGVPVILLRYDRDSVGHRSKWVDQTIVAPNPEHDETAFLTLLGEIALREPGAMLIPASDRSLGTIARNKKHLTSLGFVVAAPDEQVATTCLNKAETYALAAACGIPAPTTVPLTRADDVARYVGQAGFPAILKPTTSHLYQAAFGRKWTRVGGPQQAVEAYERARTAGLDVVLQELIPGDELCGANYNGYFADGVPLAELTATKIRNSPAETGSPSVVLSRDLPPVLVAGREVLRALGYEGFANIEFKRDPRDGAYKLIEVNARHNLSAMLALRCGINFPWLQYRHLLYAQRPEPVHYQRDIYWIDITRDLRESLSYLRRGDYSPRRFLRPYLSPHVCAVWSIRDPGPAASRALRVARMLTRAIADSALTRWR